MSCPNCGYSYSLVLDCRNIGNYKRVRKRCTNCDGRFTVYEMSDDQYKKMKQKEKIILEISSLLEALKNEN